MDGVTIRRRMLLLTMIMHFLPLQEVEDKEFYSLVRSFLLEFVFEVFPSTHRWMGWWSREEVGEGMA